MERWTAPHFEVSGNPFQPVGTARKALCRDQFKAQDKEQNMRATLLSTPSASTSYRTGTRIELPKGTVYSCRIAPETALQVRAASGALWITLEGDPEDHVLEEGETMTFTGPGLVVAEGLLASNALEHREAAPIAIARRA